MILRLNVGFVNRVASFVDRMIPNITFAQGLS